MVLNTRYSYNRFIRGSDQPAGAIGFDLASLGFSQQFINQVPKDQVRFPRINLTGYISNGHTNENRPVNNHTVASTLTKSAGRAFHPQRASNIAFTRSRTSSRATSRRASSRSARPGRGVRWTTPLASPSNIGQSVAELLLGLPDSASITRQSDYIEQSGSWGFFVQDDWKVTPRLTVNLGLRYEFETPLHERFNRSTLGFDTDLHAADFGGGAGGLCFDLLQHRGRIPAASAERFRAQGRHDLRRPERQRRQPLQHPEECLHAAARASPTSSNNKTVLRTGLRHVRRLPGRAPRRRFPERLHAEHQHGADQGQRAALPDHAGESRSRTASPSRWARPPVCRPTWDRASRTSTRTRRSRSRCAGKPACSASSAASCSKPTTSATRPTTSRSRATSTLCRGSI